MVPLGTSESEDLGKYLPKCLVKPPMDKKILQGQSHTGDELEDVLLDQRHGGPERVVGLVVDARIITQRLEPHPKCLVQDLDRVRLRLGDVDHYFEREGG